MYQNGQERAFTILYQRYSGKVYSYLKALSTRKIIHYLPRKEIPVLTFLEERLDDKNLMISPERYKFRKERYENRLKEMLRYASSRSVCRNQFLLSYFGELNTPRCGRCDVCVEEELMEPGSEEFESLVHTLSELLSEGPMLLDKIVENAGADPGRIIRVIDWLEDEGRVVREKDLRIRWKE